VREVRTGGVVSENSAVREGTRSRTPLTHIVSRIQGETICSVVCPHIRFGFLLREQNAQYVV
jgi:hypothetical protein